MEETDVELNRRIADGSWALYKKMVYEPFADVVVDIVKKNKFKDIVEVGCGQGKNGYALRVTNNLKDIRLDATEISVVAKKWAEKYYDNIYIRDDFKLPDKHYDLVLLTSVIEHIYEKNLDVLFGDIKKKLNKGGKIFVVVPNIHAPLFLLTDSKESQKISMGHVNLKSKWEWNTYFKKFGFSHTKYSFANNLPNIGEMAFFKNNLANALLRFCYRILNLFPFYYLKNSYWIEISR